MSRRGSRVQHVVHPATIRAAELRDLERCGQSIVTIITKLRIYDIQLKKEFEYYCDFPLIVENIPETLRLIQHFCIGPLKRLRKLERSIGDVPLPSGPEHIRTKVIDIIKSMLQELKVMLVGYVSLKNSMDIRLRPSKPRRKRVMA